MRDWCGRAGLTATYPTTTKPPTTSPDHAKETSGTDASTSAPCSCKERAPRVRTCRKPWTTRSGAATWAIHGAVQTQAGCIRREMVCRPTKRRRINTGRKPESFPKAQHKRTPMWTSTQHKRTPMWTSTLHIIITISLTQCLNTTKAKAIKVTHSSNINIVPSRGGYKERG